MVRFAALTEQEIQAWDRETGNQARKQAHFWRIVRKREAIEKIKSQSFY